MAALPGIVAELCDVWSLTLGQGLDGGKRAYVARVLRADGSDAVLKVAPPDLEFEAQMNTLVAAHGHGYVYVYEHDVSRRALLMEPLGSPLSSHTSVAISPEPALDVLAATLQEAWHVPRSVVGPNAAEADIANGLISLIDELWPVTGKPCSARLVAEARMLAQRRAESFAAAVGMGVIGAGAVSTGLVSAEQSALRQVPSVVCHGDPHPANLLAVRAPRPGAETGYVFVDPDGFLCDPAYDLGVTMRGWPEFVLGARDPRALVRSWAARLAALTGVDEQAIWEWAFVERVTSGLYLIRYGHDAEGRTYLASAELLV